MQSPPPGRGLGAFLDSGEIITFVVHDLDAARRFYVDQLHLPIEEEVAGRYVMVRAGSTRLCIDLADPEQPARGGGAVAILFSSNLSQAEEFLREAGVPFTSGRDPDHGSFLLLRDPEGYLLSVSEAH